MLKILKIPCFIYKVVTVAAFAIYFRFADTSMWEE